MRKKIVVIGAGHAGIEAAFAAANLGCDVVLLTSQRDTIGLMPCNPAIGGLAKSHLVFELDALGGQMAVNTDMTGLQFRVLNQSRGPAVQANRVQCDKQEYTRRITTLIHQHPNIKIVEDTVEELIIPEKKQITGIKIKNEILTADAYIFTTGTALGGIIWIGHDSVGGSGDARPATTKLSNSVKKLSDCIVLKRLKTGTPPRILKNSIDFTRMSRQDGDVENTPYFSLLCKYLEKNNFPEGIMMQEQQCSTWNIVNGFATYRAEKNQIIPKYEQKIYGISDVSRETSDGLGNISIPLYGSKKPGTDGLPCYFSHTTKETHHIISSNLSESSLYSGNIVGTGVRYCPSIEDKIVKFSNRDEHHVILEPEGRTCPWMYPNGLSNSLSKDVQTQMVRSVPGLENAEFAAFGYAIEYDCIDSRGLTNTFSVKDVPNVFFAGQVNGTTGYEEAAAQGFYAGANAALYVLGRQPLVFSRDEAYIGVMVDDLITKGTDEPYRMFTSRAERRLLLRQGNTPFRMYNRTKELKILDPVIIKEIEDFQNWVIKEIARLEKSFVPQASVSRFKYLSRPEIDYKMASGGTDYRGVAVDEIPQMWIDELTIQVKYAGYIAHEEAAARQLEKDEHLLIPATIDYMKIEHLRFEAREKLSKVRPVHLRQAASIPGVNPADIAILAILIHRGTFK